MASTNVVVNLSWAELDAMRAALEAGGLLEFTQPSDPNMTTVTLSQFNDGWRVSVTKWDYPRMGFLHEDGDHHKDFKEAFDEWWERGPKCAAKPLAGDSEVGEERS